MRISDWSSDVCSSDLAEVPDFLRPSTVRANSKELKFDKLDSGYTVATAGSDTVGRGETLQAAHLSEVGLWPKGKAKDIMNGLLQAIPNEDDTFVFVESTARGMSGPFYDAWKAAVSETSGYRSEERRVGKECVRT